MRQLGIRTVVAAAGLAGVALSLSGPAHSLTCNRGPYIVFFDSGLAIVDEADVAILQNARQSVGNCGARRAFVAGHTDTNEDPGLAETRVEVVRDWLEANGMPPDDIVTRAFGAEVPRIATVDEVSEPQNRRVEITFGS